MQDECTLMLFESWPSTYPCISEHHLHHEELASFHIENYVLVPAIAGNQNTKAMPVYLCIIEENLLRYIYIL